MDIVILEKSAFEQLLAEARQLAQRVESLSRNSQRSLQTLRSKHKICYAQLGRKFYYRPEEVELVIRQSGKYHNI